MNSLRNVIEEAIRLLQIDDSPNLYKRIRRFARKYIKREMVAPIDYINWPKGCLAVGLMNQAIKLKASSTAPERALSIRCMAEVEDYLDKWIKNNCPIYTIDDCLMGQALLMLSIFFQVEAVKTEDSYICAKVESFKAAAESMMNFLYKHKTDLKGSLPYRPAHGNDRIFADGIGMAAPYAIGFGVMNSDDDAIELGITQIRNFVKDGIDDSTGLPWHAISIGNDENRNIQTFGANGWGRAVGWITYGIQASIDFIETFPQDELSFVALRAYKELIDIRESLLGKISEYSRVDGLYGSQLLDDSSPIDTSASAMILYAMKGRENQLENDIKTMLEGFSKYIADDGQVMQAQSECMDLGVYGETYASYPWSVGMTLMIM